MCIRYVSHACVRMCTAVRERRINCVCIFVLFSPLHSLCIRLHTALGKQRLSVRSGASFLILISFQLHSFLFPVPLFRFSFILFFFQYTFLFFISFYFLLFFFVFFVPFFLSLACVDTGAGPSSPEKGMHASFCRCTFSHFK